MAADRKRLIRRLRRTLPVLAGLAVLLTALVLVSDVQQEEGSYSRHYLWVLVLTGLALATLAYTIVHRLVSLARRVREGTPGARLAARWVRNFVLLSLPPALIVYGFSVHFMTQTVDSWFDVEVEAALSDSLELGQQYMEVRTLEARNLLRRIGQDLEGLDGDPEAVRSALVRRVSASGPLELTLFERDGGLVATANIGALAGLVERPGDYALLQAVERGEYAAAEPGPGDELRIRVIRRIPAALPGQQPAFLQAIFPLPAEFTALAANVEEEYHRYQNLSYLRESLKRSFLLILTLVLALTVLLAILAALNTARRQVDPLSRLAAATREVARGDLDRTVHLRSRDELGFLAQSFNEMTAALVSASQAAEASRAELQAQGEYLETVLGSLSAGVLTLDVDGRVGTVNPAAERILLLPPGSAAGRSLTQLQARAPHVSPLVELVADHAGRRRAAWQKEVRLPDAEPPRVLLVRGSRLPGEHGGQVVVFDDVTVLNQAQREAAWAEVAKRLAHEVRNPLTPIRLAAERLRMKLTDRLQPDDARVLDRAASTIVAQVEALKTMVDAFGDYAREPELRRDELRLDHLVEDVAALYRQGDPSLEFELDLVEGPDGLAADAGRLRQLLHNLIRNAREAAGDGPARVRISTRVVDEAGQRWLELEIADDGPGFPEAILERPFEPNVTHKPGGTGLGLAICRRIVTEHDGRIALANRPSGGARVSLRLPLDAARGANREPVDQAL